MMKCIVYAVFCSLMLVSQPLFAQGSVDYDALIQKAEDAKSRDLETFKSVITTLEANQEQLSSEQRLYLVYLKGYDAGFSGDPDTSLALYYQAYEGADTSELKVLALRSIVNMYAVQRAFEKGFVAAAELHALIPTVTETSQGKARIALAIFYNKAGEYHMAVDEVSQVQLDQYDLRTQCFGISMWVEALYNIQHPDFSVVVNDSLARCESANEYVPYGLNLLFKVKNTVSMGSVNSAYDMLISDRHKIESTSYPYLQADFFAALASILLLKGELVDAEFYALEALELTNNMGAVEPKVTALYSLAQIFEQNGDFRRALDYFKQYAETEKAFLDATKVKQVAIQQGKIASIENANKIALLDNQNALLVAQARASKEVQLNTRLIAVMLACIAMATLGWAYKNRRLHHVMREKAQTDELTNIANRSHFSAESERLLKQRKTLKNDVAFIVFDLDFFKAINDNHGHLIGDWVLENAVKVIKPLLRSTDVFGRLGGEEFAILLAGCNAKQAVAVAEECRQAIEAMDCSDSGVTVSVTASFGVADSHQCGYNFDNLYGCADSALYQSKHQGRNQVYLFR